MNESFGTISSFTNILASYVLLSKFNSSKKSETNIFSSTLPKTIISSLLNFNFIFSCLNKLSSISSALTLKEKALNRIIVNKQQKSFFTFF